MSSGYVVAGADYEDDVIVKNGGGNIVDPDPGTLSLVISDPDGVVQLTVPQASLTRTAVGRFSYTWHTDSDFDTGAWVWLWDAEVEGAALDAVPVTVVVLPYGFVDVDAPTYATLDDLVERLQLPDTSRYTELSDLLVGASRYIDSRVGYDFFRHPLGSGTETRTFDVTRQKPRLPILGGIVSITDLSLATTTGDTLTALTTTDWFLAPRNLEPEGTYTHVELLRSGSYSIYSTGQGVVSITGVFGWPAVPTVIKEATLAHAGRSFHEWQTKQAGIVGNPDFGGTMNLSPNAPEIVYRAIETYRRYFWAGI